MLCYHAGNSTAYDRVWVFEEHVLSADLLEATWVARVPPVKLARPLIPCEENLLCIDNHHIVAPLRYTSHSLVCGNIWLKFFFFGGRGEAPAGL